jgi:hypothetical protein
MRIYGTIKSGFAAMNAGEQIPFRSAFSRSTRCLLSRGSLSETVPSPVDVASLAKLTAVPPPSATLLCF